MITIHVMHEISDSWLMTQLLNKCNRFRRACQIKRGYKEIRIKQKEWTDAPKLFFEYWGQTMK